VKDRAVPLRSPFLVPLAGFLAVLAACDTTPVNAEPEAVSLLGEPLHATAMPDDVRSGHEANLAAARAAYDEDPESEEAIIWLGRRTAYLGRYREAVEIFDRGLETHPTSHNLLRHRGHRHVTLRQLDLAIADLERAAALIDGLPDEIEPDGLPNVRNEPRSTSHSNIWYHLGLAYYLTGDLDNAARCYRACLAFSTNPDMLCATSHWLYMTLRRLGREDEAAELLQSIDAQMDVIENHDYHELLLMYKGERKPEALADRAFGDEGVAMATLGYGVANWYLYNDRTAEGRERLRRIVAGEAWAAFGHIAAEADLAREY
jgi:tetratricopeptide (TPR) repeat protein